LGGLAAVKMKGQSQDLQVTNHYRYA